jgi:uncharacterized membrane protein (UPF0127 family)
MVQCDNNNKKKHTPTNNNNVVLADQNYSFENPPEYRKDDELAFIDAESDEILFQIDIEVASNDIERARGLMFRAEMEENHGMLFLFGQEHIQSFYMRNTLIPLDIIYINSRMTIVDIYKDTKPLDETSLPSANPAQFVVEINAGLCEKYGLKIGDFIIY